MTRLERGFGLLKSEGESGLDCSAAGVRLAGVPLLKMSVRGFEPRPAVDLESLLEAAYGRADNVDALRRGLEVVAKALNEADLGRAMVAAVRLRLPGLEPEAAARLDRADESLTKYDPSESRDERGRWTAGGSAGASTGPTDDSHDGRPQLQPASYEPAASTRVYPWVTAFRDRRLPEAMRLAAVIGHGATADEVLAISGDESSYGRNDKATVHGNYFGIHSNGTNPANFLPGQIGAIPTAGDGPVAVFAPVSGFMVSGLILAHRLAAHADGQDLSNPDAFFALAHRLGWGTDKPGYLKHIGDVYTLVRNSARASERRT